MPLLIIEAAPRYGYFIISWWFKEEPGPPGNPPPPRSGPVDHVLPGADQARISPRKFAGLTLKPGKIAFGFVAPICRTATSAKTLRKSVVSARSLPS